MDTTNIQSLEFDQGSTVIYGLYGRCTIIGIERRQIAGEELRFYKLEIQKSPLARSARNSPAIWIPVRSAEKQGLRAPLTKDGIQEVFALLSNREYYFPLTDPWHTVFSKLEACIRTEGSRGLAKVFSYLAVRKKKQVVPSSDVSKYYETVSKALFREMSEVLEKPVRDVEDQVNHLVRTKQLLDN